MPIKNIPINLQPREKALKNGISSLNDVELLALFIRVGQKNASVFDIANKLMSKFHSFYLMKHVTMQELMQFKGIGQTKALEILGIFEIVIRIINQKRIYIKSNQAAADYAYKFIGNSMQENFFILILNNDDQILFQKIIFLGNESSVEIDPRILLSEILKRDGKRIYCFHNHPSGNTKPSKEDKMLTDSLKYYLDLFNIELINHIIISYKKGYSIVE